MGHEVIDGRDVLIAQVKRQFRLMTGDELPLAALAGVKRGSSQEDAVHFGMPPGICWDELRSRAITT
jgi:hypothetical protein